MRRKDRDMEVVQEEKSPLLVKERGSLKENSVDDGEKELKRTEEGHEN